MKPTLKVKLYLISRVYIIVKEKQTKKPNKIYIFPFWKNDTASIIMTTDPPFLSNLAGETVDWLPYGKIAIPRVELYCPVWCGG